MPWTWRVHSSATRRASEHYSEAAVLLTLSLALVAAPLQVLGSPCDVTCAENER